MLVRVCDLIVRREHEAARARLLSDYPCAGPATSRRRWPAKRLVGVFRRDGYTDRYSGARLVFPGTLRALSLLMEQAFPFHPNWKQSETHPAFWELHPTIDHVVPVARGGADDESNVVTTSMLRNSAKSNWLLDEVGWSAELAPIAPGWDGLVGWFLAVQATEPRLREDRVITRWSRALGGTRTA